MAQISAPLEARNLAEIANQLSALADGLLTGNGPDGTSTLGGENRSIDLDAQPGRYINIARRTYEDRRRRGPILGNGALLGEPAWDILLDLYIAQATQQEVSVSSACIGSAAPATTGLRWLGVLQEAGLVTRINDDEDHRRVLVKLSAQGVARMDQYFGEVAGVDNLPQN